MAAAAASAAAGAGPVPWLPSVLFSGDGTAFSEAVPNTGKGFACSYRYLNDWASTHFAAINRPMVRGRGQAGAPGWSRRCGVGQERTAPCCHNCQDARLTPMLPCLVQWENGDACARCLTCVAERCATRSKRVQVMVTDLCPECKQGEGVLLDCS